MEEGQSLADSLAKEKKYFPSDYVALVRMGEKGGNLMQGLTRRVRV
ncbi:type II secretion system F family protein [Longimonas sp.]